MSQYHDDGLERLLRQAASEFTYPPTPDMAAGIRRPSDVPPRLWPQGVGSKRRWGIALGLAAILLLATLAATPPARAVLFRILKIGVVQIFVDATPAPNSTPLSTPAIQATLLPDQVRPSQLEGATTLAEASAQVVFPLQLPSYPAELGPPDRVFVQDFGGPNVVLVWLAEDSDRAELALWELHSGAVVRKFAPRVLEQTTVGGRPAIWAIGPYLVVFGDGRVEARRLISGQVLIWEQDGVTYRLETDAGLDEARRIAESLAPLEKSGEEPGEQEEP